MSGALLVVAFAGLVWLRLSLDGGEPAVPVADTIIGLSVGGALCVLAGALFRCLRRDAGETATETETLSPRQKVLLGIMVASLVLGPATVVVTIVTAIVGG